MSGRALSDLVLQTVPLGAPPWPTVDPFLFCVHHLDAYPAGNACFGPDAPLDGRNLGSDFAGKDGWRMYHGRVVPGFPQHPHRGFETVTVTRRGYIDHADSMGAAARYGLGDVQWMTAGAGIVHAEMFPLLAADRANPVELFQIWMNLPRADKMVEPHFTMFWDGAIPRHDAVDDAGRRTEVTVIAGTLDDAHPPAPPPASWASRADADVAIWTIRMEPGAQWALPSARGPETVRTLYVLPGSSVRIGDVAVGESTAAVVRADWPAPIEAGERGAEVLVLQGRPIGEPVAQYGPFVMNDRAGIEKAFEDYQRTQFGGWPWPADDPVHGGVAERFARHADGRVEEAPAPAA